jgi:hypothetical protein
LKSALQAALSLEPWRVDREHDDGREQGEYHHDHHELYQRESAG